MAHEIDGVGADKCVARGSGVDYFYVGFGGDVGVGLGGGEDGSFRPERYDNGLDASTQKLICDNSPIERGVFDRGDGTRSQDGGFGFVEDEMGYAGVGGVGQENGGSRVEEDGDGEAGGEGEDLQNRFEGDFELEDEKGGEGGAKGGGGAEGGREEGVVRAWGEENAVFAAGRFHEDYCYASRLCGDGLDRGGVDERIFEGGDEGGTEFIVTNGTNHLDQNIASVRWGGSGIGS